VNDDSEAKLKADTSKETTATATFAKFGGHSFPLPQQGEPAFIRDGSMTILINEFFPQFFADFEFLLANFRCVLQPFILAGGH
jgi:hypothetical protein